MTITITQPTHDSDYGRGWNAGWNARQDEIERLTTELVGLEQERDALVLELAEAQNRTAVAAAHEPQEA